MIPIYAFLAMFTIQILVGSVLCPAWFIRRVQSRVASFPVERFAELFPGVDKNASGRRFTVRYRALNTIIAVLGLFLLSWLFTYMRRPDWNPGRVAGLLAAYALSQWVPLAFVGLKAARSMKVLKTRLADGKRKAVLQRRGLFDFISPFAICLAVLSYLQFTALVLYIRQHPFPGFGGLTNIVIITLAWVFMGFMMYGCLYGKNPNPLASHADRLTAMRAIVKTLVYTCIGVTVFASLQLMLSMLHLQRWGLFGVSAFCVIVTLISSLGMAPGHLSEPDGIGASRPLPPGTQDASA